MALSLDGAFIQRQLFPTINALARGGKILAASPVVLPPDTLLCEILRRLWSQSFRGMFWLNDTYIFCY